MRVDVSTPRVWDPVYGLSQSESGRPGLCRESISATTTHGRTIEPIYPPWDREAVDRHPCYRGAAGWVPGAFWHPAGVRPSAGPKPEVSDHRANVCHRSAV